MRYPIAQHADSIVVMQQNSTSTTLWLWNPVTNKTDKLLSSRWSPASVQLIPGGNGFGFLDNGVVRLKEFIKWSPKSLQWCMPIYEAAALQWIDDTHIIFHAKYRERYGIFAGTQNSQLDSIVYADFIDSLYPQVVGNMLFFIQCQRIKGKRAYQIMRSQYSNVPEHGDPETFTLCRNSGSIPLINFGSTPIAYLTMLNTNEGYCIGHAEQIQESDSTISCVYFNIYKQNGTWQRKKLFTFVLPTYLLIPTDKKPCLYEGILPLLPRQYGDYIYYADSETKQDAVRLMIKRYNKTRATAEIVVAHNNTGDWGKISNLFAPLAFGNTLVYGICVDDSIDILRGDDFLPRIPIS